MSFAVFLLLGLALYIFYRYVKNHEKLVEQVQIMNQLGGARQKDNAEAVFVPGIRPTTVNQPAIVEGLTMLRKFLA